MDKKMRKEVKIAIGVICAIVGMLFLITVVLRTDTNNQGNPQTAETDTHLHSTSKTQETYTEDASKNSEESNLTETFDIDIAAEEFKQEMLELADVPLFECYVNMDDNTLRDFAALIYLEAGGCSEECQLAVGSVILNRMTTRNSSFYDIAYAPNQFTPASRIKSTTPSQLSMSCAEQLMRYGPTIDEYVCYFRASYYFDWGDRYCNYINIDNVYFSYDSMLKARLENESV